MRDWSTSLRFCQNCGWQLYGFRNSKGIVKIECPHCHTFYLCKQVSRRKELVEITAPAEQELQ